LSPVLYMAFELGNESWKLAFTIGAAQKSRIRTIAARGLHALVREISFICQWSFVSGHLSVVICQWSFVSGHLSVVICQWSVA
jgi:hypothetical protein